MITGTPTPEPLPYAPLAVGTYSITAAPDGQWSVIIPGVETVTIRSPLKALKVVSINEEELEEITGNAADLAARSPLFLKVESQIRQGDICKFISDSQVHLRFPYSQRSLESAPLEVDVGPLNALTSASGTPQPLTQFTRTLPLEPDGTTSFTFPIEHFITPENTLVVDWYLLGRHAPLSDPLPLCPDNILVGCDSYNILEVERIFSHMRRTVATMCDTIVKAKKSGRFKLRGKTAKPFLFRRAAPELFRLRGILNSIPRRSFVCENPQPQCLLYQFPKQQILERHESLFLVPWVREIRNAVPLINGIKPRSERRLRALLAEYPDSFTTCDRF